MTTSAAKITKEKKYEVYLYRCLVNGKCYVGKTVYSAAFRDSQHRTCRFTSGIMDKAIRKHGRENFTLTVLYQGTSDREICMVEKAMIAQYDTMHPKGYNLASGGQGPSGYTHGPESRAKMSASRKGKKLSPDHVAKISAAQTGSKHKPETIALMKAMDRPWTRGRIVSEETRQKLSVAGRGRFFSEESRKKKSASMKAAHARNPRPKKVGNSRPKINRTIIGIEIGKIFDKWTDVDVFLGKSIGYSRKIMDRAGNIDGVRFLPMDKVVYERVPT